MTLNLLNYCGRSLYRIPHVTAHIRTVSYGVRNVNGPSSTKFPGYNCIFEYEHYNRVSWCNRLKYYQTMLAPLYLFTHVTVDYCFSLKSELTPILVALIPLNLIIVHVGSRVADNLIIYLYKSKRDDIIISYNTRWGKREDISVKCSDVQIIEEANGKSSMTQLLIHPTNLRIKLPIKNVKMHDPVQFESLFGSKLLLQYSK